MIEALNEAALLVDSDDIIRLANESALTMLGCVSEDVLGEFVSDVTSRWLSHPSEYSKPLSLMGATHHYLTGFKRPDGSLSCLGVSLYRHEDTKFGDCTLILLSDLLERRSNERLRVVLEGLPPARAQGSSVTQLLYDFRSILTTVSVATDAIEHEGTQLVEETALEALRGVMQWGTRVADAFEKVDVERLPNEFVNLNDTLLSIGPIIKYAVGDDMDVVVSAPTKQAYVNLSPETLQRTILNLVLNARSAMGHSDTLRLSFDVEANGFVHLKVADSGEEIPAHLHETVFMPYFNSSLGLGSRGLGLLAVASVVEEAGGHVRLDSGGGNGTVFHVYLPCMIPSGID